MNVLVDRGIPRLQISMIFTEGSKVSSSMYLASDLKLERIETTGAQAFFEWERLKSEGRGWPVIVGGDRELALLTDLTEFNDRTPEEILQRAAEIPHPEGLKAFADEERLRLRGVMGRLVEGQEIALPWMQIIGPDGTAGQLVLDRMSGDLLSDAADMPEIGEWPTEPQQGYGLSVVFDENLNLLDKVHIILVPTTDGSDVPAYLRWGGWNSCPLPEYHVAALRSWKAIYGAELVGLSGDVMNLRVDRRPATRDAALALAREQYLYCDDIVLQDTVRLAPLASRLMHSDWWFFWWD